MADGKPIEEAPQLSLESTGLAGAVPLLVEAHERGEHVVRSSFAGGDLVFLVGPEANRSLLTTQRDSFSHHAGWGIVFGDPPNLVTLEGAEHAEQRKAAWPAFTAKRMDDYLSVIDEAIRERIDPWIDLPEVDVYEETRDLTFDLAARAFLGVHPGEELAAIREQYLVDLGRQRPGARRAGEMLLLSKIHERRERPFDDALGLLTRHVRPDGSRLTDPELVAHARFLLQAGYETSASLGAWALYLLTVHPDYEQRVSREVERHPLDSPPTYAQIRELEEIDRLLLETERLYPPVPYGPRGVAHEVEIDGYVLKPGPMVMYAIASAHLLPSLWQDPTRFDPDRFAAPREEHKQDPYALVGFGGGPRRCIGMTFARAELLLLVARVLATYRMEAVPDHQVVQSYGITARPLGGMRLRALPRFAVG
jgi:cytochrome P450